MYNRYKGVRINTTKKRESRHQGKPSRFASCRDSQNSDLQFFLYFFEIYRLESNLFWQILQCKDKILDLTPNNHKYV